MVVNDGGPGVTLVDNEYDSTVLIGVTGLREYDSANYGTGLVAFGECDEFVRKWRGDDLLLRHHGDAAAGGAGIDECGCDAFDRPC